MIYIGMCLISVHTATIFKVLDISYKDGVIVLPYSKSTRTWNTDDVGLIPPRAIDKYKPIICPRSKQ